MARDVVRELLDRAVAARRFLLKRLQDDRVEVALQFSGRAGIVHGIARAPWLHFTDGPRQVVRCRCCGLVGSASRQQAVQQDAERVDVRGSRHRFAADLFRARALQRHDTHDGQGPFLGRLRIDVEQLRDAEVEQLRRPVARDQNIAGLQIAVNDQVLVRVLHGAADADEQPEPSLDREVVDVAIPVDRQAVDELHHEVRQAVVGRSAVDQAGDVRVIEVGENLAFVPETLLDEGGVEAGSDDLDRDLLVVLVIGPAAEIHGAHSAVADLSHHRVRPDPAAGPLGRALQAVDEGDGVDPRQRRRHDEGAGFIVSGEQRIDFARELGVVPGGPGQKRRALRQRQGERVLEHVLHLLPAFGRHGTVWEP